ncbi:WD40 repeat-like protein, partial [Nadsonia fulvescens var. elongata DSM 6958]
FYQNKIAKACGINLKTRILQFKPPPPKANLAAGAKAYSSLYDYEPSAWRRGYATDGGVSASCRRKICTTPIRVLDAPGMIDDFYRNLMAWSCKNVVALCLEDSVYLWNATTGKITCLIEQAPYSISSISWSEDATNLAIGMDDGIMEIWDTEVQKKVRTMRLTTNTAVGALTWNSYLLTSGSRHPSIWNHDVRIANHRVMEYRGHLAGVCGLEWKQDGTQLASGGNDNLLNIWDIRSSVAKFTKTTHKSAVKALAWCPWKPNLLASGGGCSDRQVHFWNTTTGTRLKTLDAGSQVTSLKWSIDYKEIVSTHGFPNNNIVVWNYPDLTKLVDITAHESRILHCALSPDGSTLATTAADENLKFWKLFMKNEKQKVEPMNQGGSIAKVVTIR